MRLILLTAGTVLALTTATAKAADTAELAAEGKALIGTFAGTLKGALMGAIEEGGPISAIAVCNTRAPEIAADLSGPDGWTVARSSHRLRNPANAPDAYTAAVIEDFLARQEAGEAASDLVRAEIVTEDGARTFRMTKAIPTAEACLACHGDLDPASDLAREIDEYYPEDEARGFKAGQMRGVFVLRKPLD